MDIYCQTNSNRDSQFTAQQVCYFQSLSRYPFIDLGHEKQARENCLAQGHNTQPTLGLNSLSWDHESGAPPLSYQVVVMLAYHWHVICGNCALLRTDICFSLVPRSWAEKF